MPMQSESMSKREESKDKINLTDVVDDGENHQKFEWVTVIVNKGKRKRPMLKCCRVGMRKKEHLKSFPLSTIPLCSNQQCNHSNQEIYCIAKVTPNFS